MLCELKAASDELDCDRARQILLTSVTGYEPSNGIDDLVWVRKHALPDGESPDKVIDITTRRA